MKRKIKMLHQLSAAYAEPEKFIPILKPVLHGVKLSAIDLENNSIYRVRMNFPESLFLHLDEIKYPKPEDVKSKGRFNNIGESTLYAALCELGTIYESVPQIGTLFTISRAERTDNGKLYFFPLAVQGKDFSWTPRDKHEKIVYEYLLSEVTKVVNVDDEYNSTIAIASFLLDTIDVEMPLGSKFGGVIYPSVQLKRGISNVVTYNLALRARQFDENYSIKETVVYCMTHEGDRYQLNELNKGVVEFDGKITWKYNFHEMSERIANGLTCDGSLVENIAKYVRPS